MLWWKKKKVEPSYSFVALIEDEIKRGSTIVAHRPDGMEVEIINPTELQNPQIQLKSR